MKIGTAALNGTTLGLGNIMKLSGAVTRSITAEMRDIASVAYWHQAEPHAPFPPLGSRDELEVV